MIESTYNTILVAGCPRSRTLIHYGATEFDLSKVKPLENGNWIKPKQGGIWFSPADTEFGWKDWCESEQFRECDPENSFKVKLKNSTRLLVINTLQDLKNAPLHQKNGQFILDFEQIALNHDAIWLTQEGQWATRHSRPVSLYGWDCESVLVLNPHTFEIL